MVLLLALPWAAEAARLKTGGFSVDLPEGWETQQGLMGVPLIARPPKASDLAGWEQDLLTVTVDAADKRRTCLDGFTLRRLQQLAYHSSQFEKLEELPLELDGKVATRLTVRYTEGPRELMAYVLILDAGTHFITATLTSAPPRFELQRAKFRGVVDSLRSASAGRTTK